MNYEVYDIDLSFHYEDLRTVIPILGALIGFIIFWFVWQSGKYREKLIRKHGYDLGYFKLVFNTKILGGLCMGLIPALAYKIAFPETTLRDFGWTLDSQTFVATLLWTLGLSLLMIVLTWQNALKPESLKHYPQIRAKKWTRSMMRGNLLGWTSYLLGYEALFRGVLFFPLVDQIGLWPAIAVNIGLYSATHIPKGLKETIGAIPLSVALCLICVQTGNIWVAVIVHVAMAWTNTLVSFRKHPEMELISNDEAKIQG